MKKIFIVATILLLFCLILAGIYFFVFRTPTAAPDNIELSEDANSERVLIDEDKLVQVTKFPVLTADLTLDGSDLRYVDAANNTAYRVTPRGTNKQELFALPVSDINSAHWSPKNNDLVIISPNSVQTYDSGKAQINQLKPTVDFAAWSGLDGRILYKYFDTISRTRTLNISNIVGEDWKELVPIPFRKASFASVPKSVKVSLWEDGDAFTRGSLSVVNALSPAQPEIIHQGLYGSDYLWSPDGSALLVSSTLDRGGSQMTLAVMDAGGAQYNNFGIETMVSKVVWSRDGKKIYYAQPTGIPNGAVMPNDYKSKNFMTRDTFWEMEIATGKKRRVIDLNELTEKIDAKELFLSETEDTLFFTNRINGILYALDLRN